MQGIANQAKIGWIVRRNEGDREDRESESHDWRWNPNPQNAVNLSSISSPRCLPHLSSSTATSVNCTQGGTAPSRPAVLHAAWRKYTWYSWYAPDGALNASYYSWLCWRAGPRVTLSALRYPTVSHTLMAITLHIKQLVTCCAAIQYIAVQGNIVYRPIRNN